MKAEFGKRVVFTCDSCSQHLDNWEETLHLAANNGGPVWNGPALLIWSTNMVAGSYYTGNCSNCGDVVDGGYASWEVEGTVSFAGMGSGWESPSADLIFEDIDVRDLFFEEIEVAEIRPIKITPNRLNRIRLFFSNMIR